LGGHKNLKWIGSVFSEPAVLLSVVIVIISICIIIVVIILLSRLENEKRIIRAAAELKKITNSIRAGLVHFVLEDNFKILYASQGFYDILGYDKNETREKNMISLLDFIDKSNTTFTQDIKEQLGNDTIRYEVRMITKDGTMLYMLMNGNSTAGKDGRHTLSVVFVDISEQKRMQDIILLEGERYRIATELFNDVLFEYHIQTDEMKYTNKYRDLFGMDPLIPEFKKNCSKLRDRIHSDDWGVYLEFCRQLADGKHYIEAEYRIKNRMGEFIWCQLMGKTIFDDNKHPLRVIGKMVNVDSQKKELEDLEYKATRDPLTGVYNKEVTIKKIEKFISGNKEDKHMLMLIDFDDFKSINDNYGHLAGDKVLTYMISSVKEVFSEGEIVGRIGGDEFVIFAGNIANDAEAEAKAALLKGKLDTTFQSDSNSIKISASIGVALYPEAGVRYEQLMNQADKALYRVKEQGKNNYLLCKSAI
jgi:diguanylate cyclase (GGDEF)-like protein/PAS domain S-box-containing protein